jgi:hypothetical protein
MRRKKKILRKNEANDYVGGPDLDLDKLQESNLSSLVAECESVVRVIIMNKNMFRWYHNMSNSHYLNTDSIRSRSSLSSGVISSPLS